MVKVLLKIKTDHKPPWALLGLKSNFKYFQVDQAYKNLSSFNSKIHPKIRLAWKILRDPYFGSAYKHLRSTKRILEAGFFDDEADLEHTLKNKIGDRKLITPIDKIIKQLKKISKDKTLKTNYAVLLTTGAFSPIHQGHIEMMNIAKRELENKGFKVIGGYLSPAHDGYVSLKDQGKAALSAKCRLNLCRMALKNNNWLMVDSWESMGVDIPITYTDVLKRLEKYLADHIKTTKPINIFFVFGSDNASYCRAFIRYGQCVCVERYGYDNKFTKIRKEKYIKGNKRILFIKYEDNLLKLSSTAIRQNKLNYS